MGIIRRNFLSNWKQIIWNLTVFSGVAFCMSAPYWYEACLAPMHGFAPKAFHPDAGSGGIDFRHYIRLWDFATVFTTVFLSFFYVYAKFAIEGRNEPSIFIKRGHVFKISVLTAVSAMALFLALFFAHRSGYGLMTAMFAFAALIFTAIDYYALGLLKEARSGLSSSLFYSGDYPALAYNIHPESLSEKNTLYIRLCQRIDEFEKSLWFANVTTLAALCMLLIYSLLFSEAMGRVLETAFIGAGAAILLTARNFMVGLTLRSIE